MGTDIRYYRDRLRAILAKLDQMQAEADGVLADPGDAELAAWADELRELLVDMQAKVEEKLDRLLN